MDDIHFTLPIKEVVRTAWDKAQGAKKTILIAFIIVCTATYCLDLLKSTSFQASPISYLLMSALVCMFNVLLDVGFLYIGIQRALDQPISYRMLLRGFQPKIASRVIGLYCLEFLIIFPISFLFSLMLTLTKTAFAIEASIIPKIALVFLTCLSFILLAYLVLQLFISMGLVIDRIINPWQAIKLSFKATRPHILSIAALIGIEIVVLVASALPAGIGLIWSIPLVLIINGIAYCQLSFALPNDSSSTDTAVFYCWDKAFDSTILK